jgi:hypothetical protein
MHDENSYVYSFGDWLLDSATWDRCCDRKFLRFLPIFGEKNWRFSQKPMLCVIKFLQKLAVV